MSHTIDHLINEPLPQRLVPFLKIILKPYRWRLFSLIVVALLWSIGICLKPYVVKLLLDIVTEVEPTKVVFAAAVPSVTYVALLMFDVILFRFYDYTCLNLTPHVKSNIIQWMAYYTTGHSYAFFQNNFPGSLSNKINDVARGVNDLINIVIDRFLSNMLALIFAIITFASVSSVLAYLLLIWIILFLIVTSFCGKKIHKLSHIMSESNSGVIGNIVDVFSNNMVVRFFSRRTFEKAQLGLSLKQYVQNDKAMQRYMLRLYALQGFSFASMLGLCLAYLLYARSQHLVSVGDFALILTLSLSIVECMWGISQDFSQFSERLGQVSQGLVMIAQPHEVADLPDSVDLVVTKGEISFKAVQFHYKLPKPLFDNKTVTIHGGEKVGLVGYSGSGKTTFVNLILRLYDLSAGQIFIDGQDIAALSQSSLRENIGVIPQDPVLFHRTLIENIRYGKIEATDAEIVEAARKAHAEDFIQELEQGYNTIVGERGLKLSGGQRQRIAIARAILKNAPILILDEATSALDTLTEKLIQESLEILMAKKTCIVIAHRLSTLQHLDRILVFDKGAIVEDGKHAELMAIGGLYAQLWNSQVGGFIQDESL
jgi:ATP-binding cassette subfamily B protein